MYFLIHWFIFVLYHIYRLRLRPWWSNVGGLTPWVFTSRETVEQNHTPRCTVPLWDVIVLTTLAWWHLDHKTQWWRDMPSSPFHAGGVKDLDACFGRGSGEVLARSKRDPRKYIAVRAVQAATLLYTVLFSAPLFSALLSFHPLSTL